MTTHQFPCSVHHPSTATSEPDRSRGERHLDPATEHRATDDARQHELLRRYRATGDRRLRNEVVSEFRGLAVRIARSYDRTSEPLDDRIQVAMVGLLKAADRFDPDHGTTFAAFTTVTVRGELQRHFRDHGWAVHVPRRVQERRYQVRNAIEVIGARLCRSPRPTEIAEHLGVDVDDVIDALCADDNYRLRTIEGTADRPGPIDVVADTADPGFDAVDADDGFEWLAGRCPLRLQRVLRLRFVDGLKQSEIADRLGVSQVQISRLLRQALATIRNDPEVAEVLALAS